MTVNILILNLICAVIRSLAIIVIAGVTINIDDSNIAWKSDVEYKYKQAPDAQSTQWLDVTDCKFLLQLNPLRTLYCLDAHGWSTKLQKAIRTHRHRFG